MLTLANNHILDYGSAGLYSTFSILDSLNIGYCGAGKDREEAEQGMVLENNGWRVGFLAFSLTYPEEFWATKKRCGIPQSKDVESKT